MRPNQQLRLMLRIEANERASAVVVTDIEDYR